MNADVYVEDLTDEVEKGEHKFGSRSEPKIASRKINKKNVLDGNKIFKKLIEFRNKYSNKKDSNKQEY